MTVVPRLSMKASSSSTAAARAWGITHICERILFHIFGDYDGEGKYDEDWDKTLTINQSTFRWQVRRRYGVMSGGMLAHLEGCNTPEVGELSRRQLARQRGRTMSSRVDVRLADA